MITPLKGNQIVQEIKMQIRCRLPHFVSGSKDNILAVNRHSGWTGLFDASTGGEIRTLECVGCNSALSWSPDGKTIIGGNPYGDVVFWDARAREGNVDKRLQGKNVSTNLMAWSPDGKMLACKNWRDPYNVELWDNPFGERFRRFGHAAVVTAVSWSPDGQALASGDEHRIVRLWNAKTGELFCPPLEGHAGHISALTWSPDGKVVASGASHDTNARLWDAKEGKLLRALPGHKDHVLSIAWSPNGKTIATAAGDGQVFLWDGKSEKPIHTFRAHAGGWTRMVWSPNNKTLLTSRREDDVIRFWDTSSGEIQQELKSPHGVGYLSRSNDGKYLASAGGKGFVHVYDAASGDLLRTMQVPGYVGEFPSLAWSPDDKLLAHAGGATCSIVFWDTKTGELRGKLLSLSSAQGLVMNREGHYRGTPGIENQLVYVVETDRGQETLSPEEFATKYGWKNDPERVRLSSD
jgi:WD40 repeat protein